MNNNQSMEQVAKEIASRVDVDNCDRITLSNGLPGICLLYGKLMECIPEEADIWQQKGRECLGYVVEEINKNGFDNMSMFGGLTGIGLAATAMSHEFRDYTKLINSINNTLADWLVKMKNYVTYEKGTSSMIFDTISGVTGVLSYMGMYLGDDTCYNGVESGIDVLVRMTDDILIDGHSVPGWYIPAENQFTDIERTEYPMGNFNTGMSHGIAGPITILSQCIMNGIEKTGQKNAIKKMTDFLMNHRIQYHDRDIWNGQIGYEEIVSGKDETENIFHRDGWCYGSPGICYSLICSGIVCEDKKLIDYAEENLRKSVNDIQGIFSPTICHGFSGIYQILDAAEGLLQKKCFTKEKQMLHNKIMSFYNPEAQVIFQNIEFDHDAGMLRPYDTIGFLEGAAGVALSLYSVENPKNNIFRKALLLT